MFKTKFECDTAGAARNADVSGDEPVIISAPKGAEIDTEVGRDLRHPRHLISNSKAVNGTGGVDEFSIFDNEVSFALNLFPNGYPIGKPSEATPQDVPKFLHPYDRTPETVLSAIASGQLPGDILDDLPCKYVEGALVCDDEEPSDREVTESQVKTSERILQLQFQSELPDIIWTGDSIKGKDNKTLEVALVDSLNGQVVKTGPAAFAEVEIVVLLATFDDDDWPHERFKENIVTKREGTNNSLLCGTKSLKLSGGIGAIHVNFTHRSGWKKKCQYRLGAMTDINFHGTSVREAKTQRFTLKDKRMRKGKPEIPALSDKVGQLQNIAKGGPFCEHLREKNIETVQNFLPDYFLRPQNLEKIHSLPMPKKKLNQTVQHALKCELHDKYFYQSGSSQQKPGIVFKTVGQVLGVFSEGHYCSVDKLSQMEKGNAHESVVSACEHQGEVVSFNKNSVCVHSSGSSGVLPSNMTDQCGSNAPQDNSFVGIMSPCNISPYEQNNDASQKMDEYNSTKQSNSSLGVFPINNPSPNGHDEISHMIDGRGSILPCNYTMGNISSYNLHGLMSSVDDFEVSNMEMEYGHLGCPSQELDPCLSLESMIADFDSDFALKSWEKIKHVLAFRRKMNVKRRSKKAECS